MGEYRLDIIAVTDGFSKGLQNLQEGLQDVGEAAIQTGKDASKAFSNTGGQEKFQRSLREQFLFLGKTEIELKKLQVQLKKTFDPTATAELNKQLKTVTESLIKFDVESEKSVTIQKSLKAQLRENKAVLAEMEEQGLETTDSFFKLQVQTGKLQDQINDTNERIKFFASDTKGLDGLIGVTKLATAGFAVGQGAAALFGAENENVQKALLKVNAAMAILNGLQEIQQALQKSSAARITLETAARKIKIFFLGSETIATEGLTAAQIAAANAAKILRVALISTGIGAIVALLIAAADAMGAFDDNVKETTEDVEKLNKALDDHQETLQHNTDLQIAAAKLLNANDETQRAIAAKGRKEIIESQKAHVEKMRELFEQAGQKELNKENVEAYEKAQQDLLASQDKLIRLNRDHTKQTLADLDASKKEEKEVNDKFDKESLETQKAYQEKLRGIFDANNANRIAGLNEGYEKERAQLEENQRKELVAAKKQGLDLNLLAIKFNKERIDLDQKFIKTGRENSDKAIAEENKRREEEKETIFKSQVEYLESLEQIKLLELDIEFESGTKSIVEARRIANEKLEVEIEFAEKKLELLRSAGGDVAQIRAIELAISKAKNQIKDLAKDGDSSWFLKAIGLGDISADELAHLKANIQTTINAVKQMFSDTLNFSIENNKKVIANLDEQIQKVEENIERQQNLADEGRSNNLTAERQNLGRLESERRSAFEKEKKLQRQKLNLDTVSQVSSLVTAAANIFKATSDAGPIGVAAAIVAIAAMFASFLSTQIQARKSINSQSFREGGEVKGKRHEQGGEKYYSEDGNLVEIEAGEHVIKRPMAKKYRNILNAINTDNLQSLLSGTGVGFLSEQKVDNYKQLKQSYANGEIKYRVDMENAQGNKELKELRSDFNKFAAKQDKPDISFQDGYKIEKRGNRTIRTKLK